jgi:hypothetical protein
MVGGKEGSSNFLRTDVTSLPDEIRGPPFDTGTPTIAGHAFDVECPGKGEGNWTQHIRYERF